MAGWPTGRSRYNAATVADIESRISVSRIQSSSRDSRCLAPSGASRLFRSNRIRISDGSSSSSNRHRTTWTRTLDRGRVVSDNIYCSTFAGFSEERNSIKDDKFKVDTDGEPGVEDRVSVGGLLKRGRVGDHGTTYVAQCGGLVRGVMVSSDRDTALAPSHGGFEPRLRHFFVA